MRLNEDWEMLRSWMRRSKEALELLAHASDSASVAAGVGGYIQCRFMLGRLPRRTERIYDLAEEGAAIMAGLPQKQLAAMEEISGCTGAKSAMIKKVLLLMALKEGLGWPLSEAECLAMDTVDDIILYCMDVKRRADQTR